MPVNILKSGTSLTAEDLQFAEQRLGIMIPVEYRAFLLEHNGGYPDPSCFQMFDKQLDRIEWGCVDWILGIHEESTNNLERYLRTFRDRLPAKFLPFAHDPGGNLICVATEGSDQGKIYFWAHEFEVDDGEVPGFENVYYIADNFGEFFDSLTEES